MNLFKRIAVIAIAAILVLTLAACTSPAEPEEQESSSDQPEVVTIKVGGATALPHAEILNL